MNLNEDKIFVKCKIFRKSEFTSKDIEVGDLIEVKFNAFLYYPYKKHNGQLAIITQIAEGFYFTQSLETQEDFCVRIEDISVLIKDLPIDNS